MARRTLLIEPPPQPGRCRSCGAAIEWMTTVAGTRMPFNPPVIVMPALGLGDVKRVEVDMSRSVSHFATCTDPTRWRKTRR